MGQRCHWRTVREVPLWAPMYRDMAHISPSRNATTGARVLYLITTMGKLPSQVPLRLKNNAYVGSAYSKCLGLEKAIQEKIDGNEDVGRDMIYCRIMGYLIHHAPNDQALRNIVYQIGSCENDEALLKVGKHYYDHFIRACTFVHVSMFPCPQLFQFDPIKGGPRHPRIIHLAPRSIH